MYQVPLSLQLSIGLSRKKTQFWDEWSNVWPINYDSTSHMQFCKEEKKTKNETSWNNQSILSCSREKILLDKTKISFTFITEKHGMNANKERRFCLFSKTSCKRVDQGLWCHHSSAWLGWFTSVKKWIDIFTSRAANFLLILGNNQCQIKYCFHRIGYKLKS